MDTQCTPCTQKTQKHINVQIQCMQKSINKLDEMENLNTKVNFQLPF